MSYNANSYVFSQEFILYTLTWNLESLEQEIYGKRDDSHKGPRTLRDALKVWKHPQKEQPQTIVNICYDLNGKIRLYILIRLSPVNAQL